MQMYAHQLIGFSLNATDGEIGKVKDIYFDDRAWRVRYLVVDTGNWLFKRKVLISPGAVIDGFKGGTNTLSVNLNKDQVKDSPDIDTDMPVSRQQESSLFDHYSWPEMGGAGMGYPTTGMLKGASALVNKSEQQDNFDPHLRSFLHVQEYEVHNTHGRIGIVKDLFVDQADWSVPYLLLDDVFTSNKERVVVDTNSVVSINWDTQKVTASLTHEDMQKAPRINPEGFFAEDGDKQPPVR